MVHRVPALLLMIAVGLQCSPATAQGPAHLVKDINLGGDPYASSFPRDFAVVRDVAYFTADDGVHGCELWRTDGTQAGTRMVKDIRPGPEGSCISDPDRRSLFPVDDRFFFRANDGITGVELWVSDGTADGTRPRTPTRMVSSLSMRSSAQ